jgi:hypothetical protein
VDSAAGHGEEGLQLYLGPVGWIGPADLPLMLFLTVDLQPLPARGHKPALLEVLARKDLVNGEAVNSCSWIGGSILEIGIRRAVQLQYVVFGNNCIPDLAAKVGMLSG